jgi:hypothetical protein
MKQQQTPFSALPILEADAFERANVEALGLLMDWLRDRDLQFTLFPESRGRARLLNLIDWQVSSGHEYLDGDAIFADQVLHVGLHHAVDATLGKSAAAMLYGEALASASDLYALGLLSKAGEETDFVADTMESFGAFYEMYGEEAQLERLLQKVTRKPYDAMLEVCNFLYQTLLPLLYPEQQETAITTLEKAESSHLYPLLHHFNTSNWVFLIRRAYAELSGQASVAELQQKLAGGQKAFYAWLTDLPES